MCIFRLTLYSQYGRILIGVKFRQFHDESPLEYLHLCAVKVHLSKLSVSGCWCYNVMCPAAELRQLQLGTAYSCSGTTLAPHAAQKLPHNLTSETLLIVSWPRRHSWQSWQWWQWVVTVMTVLTVMTWQPWLHNTQHHVVIFKLKLSWDMLTAWLLW